MKITHPLTCDETKTNKMVSYAVKQAMMWATCQTGQKTSMWKGAMKKNEEKKKRGGGGGGGLLSL